jgi:tRNA pseudouridine55 synthase
LARDLGNALGVGGHLTALRRTTVGHFTLERAVSLEVLELDPRPYLVELSSAAAEAFPVRRLDPDEATAVGHGRRLSVTGPAQPGPVAAIGPDGHLVAMLEESADSARSLVVFRPGRPD